MRPVFLSALVAILLGLAGLPSCSSAATTADAGSDASGVEGGFPPPPSTEACTGPTTSCLRGTAAPRGFKLMPIDMEVNLFRVFPSAGAKPIATMPVALDGTWAFSGVPAWAHYYVQLAANYGGPTTVTSLTGPLSVPSSAAQAIAVEPVQLTVLEQSVNGVYQVDWAEAQIVDPTSGAPVTESATVAIAIGAATTPMPWGAAPGGTVAYFVQFPQGSMPSAQHTYTITTSAPAFGSTPASWQLSAAPPTFTGSITSPAASASITHGQPLSVTWPAEPGADFIVVELFHQVMGQWSPVYESPLPDGPDVTTETIPADKVAATGNYLLNVDFSTASCPATSDGCVLASTAAEAQVTAE
jgi:hypothetical protein